MRTLLLISLVLAVTGIGAGCTPIPTASSVTQASTVTAAPAPGAQAVLDGIPVGFTEEGYPYRGAADAPVTLVEYSDYLCPYCARHATQTVPSLIEKYIRPGQMKWVFRDFPIASLHPTSAQGHMAAQCVAEQGAALFWQMHDKLFATQTQWNQLPDPGAYLAQVAQGLGADMAAYSACVAAGRAKAAVDKGIADAGALGFNGTPSFQFLSSTGGGPYTLDGAQPVDTFAGWIDALLAGNAPPVAVQEEVKKPELPFWAKPEGLAPDPERPGFTMAGDPYKGDPEAPLVVVEFSDFQCPACAKHALQTQPAVDKQFVDTGDILWVFKNLPLQEHPQAAAAAVAAECAGEQGKFWEMHDALFAAVDRWAVDDPDAALAKLAGELKLDSTKFASCLGGRQALERVMADVYDAQGIVSTTPSFIALYGGTGTIYRGATSVDAFQETLQVLLEAAQASGK